MAASQTNLILRSRALPNGRTHQTFSKTQTMALRGQRFTVDLSDDDDETGSASRISPHAAPSIPGAFIGDIQERSSTAPPVAPKLKTTTSGFPEHRKRARVSAFKQQRGALAAPAATASRNNSALPQYETPLSTNSSRNDLSFDEEERK